MSVSILFLTNLVTNYMNENLPQHLMKAQKGVLEYLLGCGGIAEGKDLHDFSEMNYGVGHQNFSKLMEYLVDLKYITYNNEEHQILLQDSGREYFTTL